MADRVRAFDWAATPMGRLASWPERLCGAVETMLASPQLASLAIGPARIFLYNDAAARQYGPRHPDVLGLPLGEAFAHEIAEVEAFYDRAFAGESLHVPAQPLDPAQTGKPELFDAYLTPIRGDRGEVVAVQMTGFAVGERHRAAAKLRESEARQALLLRLSDALRMSGDPAEIRRTAMRLLGEQLGLARIYYFDVESDAQGGWTHVIERGYQRDSAQPEFVGPYPLRHFASWMFEGFARGEVVAVHDTASHPGLTDAERAACRSVGVAAFINVPLLRQGEYAAGIGAHDIAPRAWRDSEIELIREVAARVWTASERRLAQTALRESEERHRRDLKQQVGERTAELAASRDLLRGTMDASTDMIQVFEAVRDASGEIADFRWVLNNKMAERRYGEVRGESLLARNPGVVAEGIFETFKRVTETGVAEQAERHYVHEQFDGWFYQSVVKLNDGVATTTKSIDDWKAAQAAILRLQEAAAQARLQESEARFRTLADTAPAMIWQNDTNGESLYVNRYFLDYTRLPQDRIGGVRWQALVHPDHADAYVARYMAAVRDRGAWRDRNLIRRHDGAWHWFDNFAQPLFGLDGRYLGHVGVSIDIQASVDTEAALRESEERQAFLLALSDMLRPLSDPARIEGEACRLLGDRLDVHHTYYVWFDESRDRAVIRRDHARHGVASLAGEYRLSDYGWVTPLYRQGNPVVIEDIWSSPLVPTQDKALAARPHRAMVAVPLVKGGELVGALYIAEPHPRAWSLVEIALVGEVAGRILAAVEHADAEAALRESEARLALAFRTLPVGIAIIDANCETVMANDGMRRFLPAGSVSSGYPERSARWRGWDAHGETVRPEDFPTARALRGEAVSPGMQMLYRDDGGREIWTEVLSAPLRDANGKLGGAITVVIDVDRLKRSTEAARASEERLRQFGEASQDILWIRDAATLQWIYLTPAFEPIYGLSRRQALAGDNYMTWQDLILPEDRAHAAAAIERVAAGEWVTFEYRVRRPGDDAVRWLRDTDFPITDATGKVVLIGGIGHDFTDVREAERRLQTLVEGMPQLVWRAVDGGAWTWASPQWILYTGQEYSQFREFGWLEAIHPDDRAAAREAWSHAGRQGGFKVEHRIRRHVDGEHRWFQTRATPVRDHAGTIVEWLGTSNDIHELRALQERQHVLVAELQHRTRNLMGVVRAVADNTVRASSDLPDFRNRFRDRLRALARVQGLLSRMNDHDRVTFDVLVETELAAMGGSADRVTLRGPSGVRLRSSTVQTLALALHELATNAVKYGALGQASGRLAITWRLETSDGRPWLHIDWRESEVEMPPPDTVRSGNGQGRELIERALPYQLGARTSYALGPDGAHCTISIPVSASPVEDGEPA